MRTLALFDFDGTITTKDSLVEFIKYAVGKSNYYLGLLRLSPMLAAYTLNLIPNNIAKERMLSYFFKGYEEKDFQEIANAYSLNEIDKILRIKAIEKIRWHQAQGHKVVIVSASIESWLKPWCQKYNIDLISTHLEIKEGKLSGKFLTRNCYGPEKANRVKIDYDFNEYDHIYAYGDSNGDRELLALANESFYKPFREA